MTKEKTTFPVAGACRCGDTTIAITSSPLITSACHCTGCQRMTSSAFSLTASIPVEGFSVSRGEPIIGGLHGATRHMFCPRCLTWMFTHPDGYDFVVNVRAPLLEVASWSTPFIEVFTSEKISWATTPAVHSYETIPAFEGYKILMAEYAAQSH